MQALNLSSIGASSEAVTGNMSAEEADAAALHERSRPGAGAALDAVEHEHVCLAAVAEEPTLCAAGVGTEARTEGASDTSGHTKAVKAKRPGNAMRALATVAVRPTREALGTAAADNMLKKIVNWLGTLVFASSCT